jgi:hypothetical protein
MKLAKILTIVATLVCCNFSMAQTNGIVKGRVVVEGTDKPLKSASITLIGAKKATATDDNGNFYIKLPDEKKQYKLSVTYQGYATKEIAVKAGDNLTVKLKEDVKDEGEVVIQTGYGGGIKKKEATFSASNIGAKDLKGLSSALKGLPSSYKDEVLAAAKEFSKGDEEVNAKLEELLGKDKKRSEDFKNESSRMYLNKFFSGMAQAAAEPGQSGIRGIIGTAAKSAGKLPEYESELRKEQNQYDMLLEKNTVDNLKYKVALKDRNFDRAANLQKAIKDNQYQMQHLQQQAAATAAHTQLGMAQLEETKGYHQMMGDVYKGKNKALEGANRVRLAGMEAKVMPLFQNDPNTRKLAKQLEDQYGKNWQSQDKPQREYWSAYQTFKARTMPSLAAESADIPYSTEY